MSNPITVVATNQDFTGKSIIWSGLLQVLAGNYTTGSPPSVGIPVSFGSAVVGCTGGVPIPGTVSVRGLSGYDYDFDDATQTLRIFDAGTELTGGSIPTQVVADTISVSARFNRI
jgi:hypothetical protein